MQAREIAFQVLDPRHEIEHDGGVDHAHAEVAAQAQQPPETRERGHALAVRPGLDDAEMDEAREPLDADPGRLGHLSGGQAHLDAQHAVTLPRARRRAPTWPA